MAVSPVMHSAAVQNKTAYAASDSDNGLTPGTSTDELLDNFMTLLVTQMRNQDPTNPMDNNQLTSQLAQFNTAAGVEKLNTTVATVGALVNSMQAMSASSWVGRTVLIEGDPQVTADEGQQFGLNLNTAADTVTVTFTDKEGNTYTHELKNVDAGVHKYDVSELTTTPELDPSKGPFKVSLSASNNDGSKPDITALKSAKVEAVSFASGGAQLELGLDGAVPLGKVYLVE